MKTKLLIIFILTLKLNAFGQNKQYIIFEEHAPFDTVNISPFKLLYNHVVISGKNGNGPSLNIFNLYFSKYNFQIGGLDSKAFVKSTADYRKIGNDVLITFIPLTDSLKQKMVRLTSAEVSNLTILKPEEILQSAIKNLYRSFTENSITKDDIPGIIKTMRYKLLIKKGNSYYGIDSDILTEFYLIDRESYLFPYQYHGGEINIAAPGETQYFNGGAISNILKKFPSNNLNNYYSIKAVSNRTFPDSVEASDIFSVYTYWNNPIHSNRLSGIERFQFIEGIGIINGAFGLYFGKHFLMTPENDDKMKDFNGEFRMTLSTINGVGLKKYGEEIKKRRKPGQIIEIE